MRRWENHLALSYISIILASVRLPYLPFPEYLKFIDGAAYNASEFLCVLNSQHHIFSFIDVSLTIKTIYFLIFINLVRILNVECFSFPLILRYFFVSHLTPSLSLCLIINFLAVCTILYSLRLFRMKFWQLFCHCQPKCCTVSRDCSVNINDLRDGQSHDMWLPLQNVKMGRLHLAITILDDNEKVILSQLYRYLAEFEDEHFT